MANLERSALLKIFIQTISKGCIIVVRGNFIWNQKVNSEKFSSLHALSQK